MKRLVICIVLLLFASYVFAADRNIDVDGNKATDIASGGTNATTAANARTNLGVAPALGTDDNYVTDAEKTKLTGIAEGAEVNVNADWNASSGDAQILNKPTIPTVSDTAYGTGWNGDTGAASKNALYDKIETITGGSMTYPDAGIPVSTGTAWGTSIVPGTGVAAALGYAPDTTGGFLLANTYLDDPDLIVETTPTNGVGYRVPASSWAVALDSDGDGSLIDETWWTTAMGAKLNTADIDDTAVNGETAQPISSNWAYVHAAATAAHGATGEVVGTTNTQTLTNKSLTSVEVDGSASVSLTAAQVSSTIVTNRGQSAADVALGLPTAAAGYASVFTVGTTQSNKWGVRAGASDKIYLIAAAGTVTAGADNGYARMTAAQVGQAFACWTFQTGVSEWDWMCKAGSVGTSTFVAN